LYRQLVIGGGDREKRVGVTAGAVYFAYFIPYFIFFTFKKYTFPPIFTPYTSKLLQILCVNPTCGG